MEINLPINFFPKVSKEDRPAVEFFELPDYATIVTIAQVRDICRAALKRWAVNGAVPYYLSECYNVFDKGAAAPENETKAFIKECFELWKKSHRVASMYGIGYIRDVEAAAVWEWLAYSIINTL